MKEIIDAKDVDFENAELVTAYPFSLVRRALLSGIFLSVVWGCYLVLYEDITPLKKAFFGVGLLSMLLVVFKWAHMAIEYRKTKKLHPAIAIEKASLTFNIVSLWGNKYRRIPWDSIHKASVCIKKTFMAEFCVIETQLYSLGERAVNNPLKAISFVAGDVHCLEDLKRALSLHVKVDDA